MSFLGFSRELTFFILTLIHANLKYGLERVYRPRQYRAERKPLGCSEVERSCHQLGSPTDHRRVKLAGPTSFLITHPGVPLGCSAHGALNAVDPAQP